MSHTNIKITGLNTAATRQSPSASGMKLFYFSLSDLPPHAWAKLFDEERRFPRHTMWRRAWVEGANIVVDCAPDEIEKYHLRDIKQDVENTNNKYQMLQQAEIGRREKVAEDAFKERQEIEDLAKRLDFD